VVHQYQPYFVGGTELYTQTLARCQAGQGHSVSVFCPSPVAGSATWPRAEVEDQVRVYRVPVGKRSPVRVFLSAFAHRRLSRAFAFVLEQERPDLVHIQHLMGLPVDLAAQLSRAGIPYVITLHDYWYLCANAQLLTNYSQQVCSGPRFWINCGHCGLARAGWANLVWLSPLVAPLMAYRHLRLRSVLRRARQIIAPTNFVRDASHLSATLLERVRVVPHGIQVPENLERAQAQGPEHDDLRVAYIGSLAFQKGVHVLIEAVNQLPHEGVRLSIYGDVNVFPAYVSELKQLARHPGISFAGRVARADMWNVLGGVDALVMPSLWYEASPLVMQEAFAAGVPLIASSIGALRELVRDGVDGFLFPPGDARALQGILARLLSDPAQLVQLRANIRPVRTIQDHVKDVEAVYRIALRS
jgi:glycosyltransferase involved in cell wall biosynthesis